MGFLLSLKEGVPALEKLVNIVKMIADRIENIPLTSKDTKIDGELYMHPSSAMVSTDNGEALGSCIRRVFFDKSPEPFKVTNPTTSYNIMITDSGNMWEAWVIEKYKQLGIYLDNSIKIVDNTYKISCELDILHTNPEENTVEVTEVKSYAGNNYSAVKEVLGTEYTPPKPKDQNLLQVVCYLLVLKRYNINKVNLLYIDRSSSSFFNNKQFIFYLDGDDIYYSTLFKGEWIEVKETRFTVSSIIEKWNVLIQMLEMSVVPPPDYYPQYTDSILESEYAKGLVTKTNYSKAKSGVIQTHDMCSYQCRYCPYWKNKDTGESICLNHK